MFNVSFKFIINENDTWNAISNSEQEFLSKKDVHHARG